MNTFIAIVALCIIALVLYTYNNKNKQRAPQVLKGPLPPQPGYGPVRQTPQQRVPGTPAPRRRSPAPGLSAPPDASFFRTTGVMGGGTF